MGKLLSANLDRMGKNRIFWAEMVLTAVFSLFIVLVNYSPKVQTTTNRLYLDNVFFIVYQLLGFILAAGVGLFVGTEYADGTIRNKLIVGHTRAQVYFSGLISSAVPSCLVLLVHGIVTFGAGWFLFGGFQMPVEQVLTALSCALLATLVYAALFVAVAMNCSNRSITAVASLLLALGLLYLAAAAGNALAEPEMIYDSVTITMDGVRFGDWIRNPAHVSGTRRTLYELVYDLLPSGQLTQMYSRDFARSARWPVFSVLLFVLETAVGFLAFRRKDLK